MTEIKEKKTEEKKEQQVKQEEYVEYTAFKDDGNYKDDIVVGLNGRIYTIQRGVKVKLPKKVYEIIQNAEAQRNNANNLIEQYENDRNAVIAKI